jgi:hypothetical protein
MGIAARLIQLLKSRGIHLFLLTVNAVLMTLHKGTIPRVLRSQPGKRAAADTLALTG